MIDRTKTERPLFGVFGTGGCGRSVLPVADEMLALQYGKDNFQLAFIDDALSAPELNGRSVFSPEDFVAAEATSKAAVIAVADPRIREKLDRRCREHGLDYFSIVAPNAVMMDEVQIGEGAMISPFVTITSNVRIGRHFHANLYSYVEHDCCIGDFVTFAPSVCCNGNIIVEDYAYLGAGCIVRQGTPNNRLIIGKGAVIGMGAVVTKSVPPGVTVVGNPARPISEKS